MKSFKKKFLIFTFPLVISISSTVSIPPSYLAPQTVSRDTVAINYLATMTRFLDQGGDVKTFFKDHPVPTWMQLEKNIFYRSHSLAMYSFQVSNNQGSLDDVLLILTPKTNPFVFPKVEGESIFSSSESVPDFHVQIVKNEQGQTQHFLLAKTLEVMIRHSGRKGATVQFHRGATLKEIQQEIIPLYTGQKKSHKPQSQALMKAIQEANPDRISVDQKEVYTYQQLTSENKTVALLMQSIANKAPLIRSRIQAHVQYYWKENKPIQESLEATISQMINEAVMRVQPSTLSVKLTPIDSAQELLIGGGAGTVVGFYDSNQKLIHSFYLLFGPKITLMTPFGKAVKEFVYRNDLGFFVENNAKFHTPEIQKLYAKGKGQILADGGSYSEKPPWWNNYVRKNLEGNKVRYTESPTYITNEIVYGGGILQEAMPRQLAEQLGFIVKAAGGDWFYHSGRLFAGSKDLIKELRDISKNEPEKKVAEQIPSIGGVILSFSSNSSMTDLNSHLEKLSLEEDVRAVIKKLAQQAVEIQTKMAEIPGGKSDFVNESGDQQAPLDIIGHESIVEAFQMLGTVKALVSEEPTYVYTTSSGDEAFAYEPPKSTGAVETQLVVFRNSNSEILLAVDPLDGSSKLDTNGSVGLTAAIYKSKQALSLNNVPLPFSVEAAEKIALPLYKRAHLQATLFVLFGPTTNLVLATPKGVFVYLLNQEGTFHLRNEQPLQMQETGNILSMGGVMNLQWPNIKQFVDKEFQQSNRISGYGGSMIGDVMKVLSMGGVFAYPPLVNSKKEKEEGKGKYNLGNKLRQLVETNIASYIVEQAGGVALTLSKDYGISSSVDRTPKKSIEQIPLFVGSKKNMERFVEALISDLGDISSDSDPANAKLQGVAKEILELSLQNGLPQEYKTLIRKKFSMMEWNEQFHQSENNTKKEFEDFAQKKNVEYAI